LTSTSAQTLIGSLLVLAAAISWSTAGLFTRLVSTDVPTTLFWRSISGGLCVLIIYAIWNKTKTLSDLVRISRGEWVIAVLSALGMICFISAFFYTTIANVTFLYGAMPLVTLVLSAIFLGERLTIIAALCCVLAVVGVGVIVWGEQDFSNWTGFLLAFGMTFFMSALTIAAKFYPTADMMKATYLSAFLAAILMLPFSGFSNTAGSDYAWLLLYGIVNVGLGFGVYLLGVGRVPALMAALIGLVEIPLAPIWGWLLFNEPVGTKAKIGGAVVLTAAAVYLIARSFPRSSAKSLEFPTPSA
jgi:drug/metabolite transporter (DMT)-like permease